MKVVLCTPTYDKPHPAFLKAVEDAVPALDALGIDHAMGFEVQNPYISNARAVLLRRALDAKAEKIIFLDHDLSFRPSDLVKLIETEGDVVMGTYRFKKDEEEYMGKWATVEPEHKPVLREDGCFKAYCGPAGFLKFTQVTVQKFMEAYPELNFGPRWSPTPDIFNHGAYGALWFGEDYAFCRRWNDLGGDIWMIPDLNIDHHQGDTIYRGNLHNYMRRQPGGDLCGSE